MTYDNSFRSVFALVRTTVLAWPALLLGCSGSTLDAPGGTEGDTEGAAQTEADTDGTTHSGETQSGETQSGETESETETPPGDCPQREVMDSMSSTGFAAEVEVLQCAIAELDVAGSTYTVSLHCRTDDQDGGDTDGGADTEGTEGDAAPEVRSFVFEAGGPDLEGAFPLEEDREVELHSWNEDFPPFDASFVLRDASDGALLFAWIEDFAAVPALAEPSFLAPLSANVVGGLCPAMNVAERRAISVAHEEDDVEVTVIDGTRDVLATRSDGRFEVRVRASTYDPEIAGGCNSCNRYSVLAVPD